MTKVDNQSFTVGTDFIITRTMRFSQLMQAGKIVMITTGADDGIGAAVAAALAGEGSKLWLEVRDTKPRHLLSGHCSES